MARGAQRPTELHLPTSRYSSAADAVALVSSYGLELDDWQQWLLKFLFGERADGKWTISRGGICVARQNGKGAVIEAVELAGLLLFGETRIIHSAHRANTARDAFTRLLSYFENYPDLSAKIKKVGTATAREYIQLKRAPGQREDPIVTFQTRTRGGGRGFPADRVIFDEAQELSDLAWDALVPTKAAKPNPQIVLFGTAPGPDNNAEVFTRMRNNGLAGTDRRLGWAGWCGEPGDDLDDPAVHAKTNPAYGIRLSRELVQDERADMSEDGFGRERCSIWLATTGVQVIDDSSWAACADAESLPVQRLVLGVDVNPDRTMASVCLAGVRDDGFLHVELDETRAGTGWVAGYVASRVSKNPIAAIVVDGVSPAASLVDEIKRKAKIRDSRIKITSTTDMAAACGLFYDSVMDCNLRHLEQPQLTAALTGARKRSIGDRWAWNRKNQTVDITPLVGATLALWGANSAKVKGKTRERRVVVHS